MELLLVVYLFYIYLDKWDIVSWKYILSVTDDITMIRHFQERTKRKHSTLRNTLGIHFVCLGDFQHLT